MNFRHAYMIMAHHRPDLLRLLLSALDDKRNDIIVHLDKKSFIRESDFSCNNARLYFIPRMVVNWGGYSQVQCEMILFKFAINIGSHSYYHFLSGANFPLWNQNYIHKFFEKNYGTEFVGFEYSSDFSLRAKYYQVFTEIGKLTGIKKYFILLLRNINCLFQSLLKIDRRKKTNWTIQKGCAYFSVTEGFIKEVIKNENNIKKIFSHTICCDELFIQTIAYNSKFKSHLYNINDEFEGCLREFAFDDEHPGWNYKIDDLDFLLNSKKLFAMKFEGSDGINIIKKLNKIRKIL